MHMYMLFNKSKIYIKTLKTLLHVLITQSPSGRIVVVFCLLFLNVNVFIQPHNLVSLSCPCTDVDTWSAYIQSPFFSLLHLLILAFCDHLDYIWHLLVESLREPLAPLELEIMFSSKSVITEVTKFVLIVRTGQCTVKLNFPDGFRELFSMLLCGQPFLSPGFFL